MDHLMEDEAVPELEEVDNADKPKNTSESQIKSEVTLLQKRESMVSNEEFQRTIKKNSGL